MELDALDVTPILTLEGTEIVVRPPRPLKGGTHRISLSQLNEAGEVTDRGSWSFKVGQAVAYQARADASLIGTYRVNTSNIPEESLPADRGTAEGSLRLEASAGTASWEVSGNIDGVWTNQPAAGAAPLRRGQLPGGGARRRRDRTGRPAGSADWRARSSAPSSGAGWR